MMLYTLYFFLAFAATMVGSLTGMGGGVIIKPLMDIMRDFNVETIGVLSSITVFCMSIVSIGKQMWEKSPIPFRVAVPLVTGSVAGGYWGQEMLRWIVTTLGVQELVTVVQNGAVAGGFIGADISRRCSEKTVDRAFRAVQLMVLGITLFNIVRNLQ